MYLTFDGIYTQLGRMMTDSQANYFATTEKAVILQGALDDFAAQTRLLKVSEKAIVVPAAGGGTYIDCIIPESTLLGTVVSGAGAYILDIESVEWNRDSSGVAPNWVTVEPVIGREGWAAKVAAAPTQTSSTPAYWYSEYVTQEPTAPVSPATTYTSLKVKRQLRIYPRPTDSTNARLRWTGHRSHCRLALLDTANSYPEFPNECTEALLNYCMWFLCLEDDDAGKAQMFWQKYMEGVVKAGGTYSPKALEYPRLTPRKAVVAHWGARY